MGNEGLAIETARFADIYPTLLIWYAVTWSFIIKKGWRPLLLVPMVWFNTILLLIFRDLSSAAHNCQQCSSSSSLVDSDNPGRTATTKRRRREGHV
jgi:hypothetical protein